MKRIAVLLLLLFSVSIAWGSLGEYGDGTSPSDTVYMQFCTWDSSGHGANADTVCWIRFFHGGKIDSVLSTDATYLLGGRPGVYALPKRAFDETNYGQYTVSFWFNYTDKDQRVYQSNSYIVRDGDIENAPQNIENIKSKSDSSSYTVGGLIRSTPQSDVGVQGASILAIAASCSTHNKAMHNNRGTAISGGTMTLQSDSLYNLILTITTYLDDSLGNAKNKMLLAYAIIEALADDSLGNAKNKILSYLDATISSRFANTDSLGNALHTLLTNLDVVLSTRYANTDSLGNALYLIWSYLNAAVSSRYANTDSLGNALNLIAQYVNATISSRSTLQASDNIGVNFGDIEGQADSGAFSPTYWHTIALRSDSGNVGGAATDWSAAEKNQLRRVLGISGDTATANSGWGILYFDKLGVNLDNVAGTLSDSEVEDITVIAGTVSDKTGYSLASEYMTKGDSSLYMRTDWDNIKNPTTYQNFSDTRIHSVDSLGEDISAVADTEAIARYNWAYSSRTLTSFGSGAFACSVYTKLAADSSTLAGIHVIAMNTMQDITLNHGYTDANGLVIFPLDSITGSGFHKFWFIDIGYNFTFPESADVNTDTALTFYGSAFDYGDPPPSNQCAVYDQIFDLQLDSLSGVVVTAELRVPNDSILRYNDFPVSPYKVTYTTGVSGRWRLDLIPNSDFLPSDTWYLFKFKFPEVGGKYFIYEDSTRVPEQESARYKDISGKM